MRFLRVGQKAAVAGALFWALLMLGGCSAGDPVPQPSPASVASGRPQSPPGNSDGIGTPDPSPMCPAALPSTISVSGGTVSDGKSFAFVHHFDGVALYVDPAEFFGGEAAERAAREDGEIGPNEDLPNPFYIRNPSKVILRVPVSAKLRVSLLNNDPDRGPTLRDRTSPEFATLYCGGVLPEWVYSVAQEMPVNLTVVHGAVARVIEQYLP